MKKLFLMGATLACLLQGKAQQIFSTRHGQVSFFSKTPVENIDAVNNDVASALNMQTGALGFSVLIKSFHFDRALMEEHFNENYMDSDNMPKAIFKGKVNNVTTVTLARDDAYSVTAEGDLTVHGVTRKVVVPGTLLVKAGQLQLRAEFTVAPKDYNIKIPGLVQDKIAQTMNVSVDCKYETSIAPRQP